MKSIEDVLDFVKSEDISFIRLAFCDINGGQKNKAIMAGELEHAFRSGIPFDPSKIKGFDDILTDLYLRPDPDTMVILPWRPEQNRVGRMICEVRTPDGEISPLDKRSALRRLLRETGIGDKISAVRQTFCFALKTEKNGRYFPHDPGGYMDTYPSDLGEDIRRKIILSLESMGIRTISSHHDNGDGRSSIRVESDDILSAADSVHLFINALKNAADERGLYAELSESSYSVELLPKEGVSLDGISKYHTVQSCNADPYAEYLRIPGAFGRQ